MLDYRTIVSSILGMGLCLGYPVFAYYEYGKVKREKNDPPKWSYPVISIMTICGFFYNVHILVLIVQSGDIWLNKPLPKYTSLEVINMFLGTPLAALYGCFYCYRNYRKFPDPNRKCPRWVDALLGLACLSAAGLLVLELLNDPNSLTQVQSWLKF